MTESIQDVFWMSTCGVTEMLYISPAYENIWGRITESLYQSPRSFLESIHPDDVEPFLELLEKYHKNAQPYEGEYRILDKNGRIKWIRERGFPAPDLFSGVQLMAGVCTDISTGKLAESALRDSEELHREILESITEAVFLAGKDGELLYISPNISKIFGYSIDEVMLLGNIFKLLGDNLYNRDELADAGEYVNVETVIYDKFGLKHALLVNIKETPIKGESIIISCRDITAKMEAEEALKDSERLYRQVTEHLAEGVAVFQGEEVVFYNEAMRKWFDRFSPNEFPVRGGRGSSLPENVHTKIQELSMSMDKEGSREEIFTFSLSALDGEEIWTEVRCTAVKWSGRSSLMTTFHDITQAKARELAIKNEAEGLKRENIKLRSTMSYRYRLGPIIGKSDSMQKLYELVIKAANSEANVIITGESGSGKELIAQTIFNLSNHYKEAFTPVNCGAIPETLFESEFFGHKKGAFTGADHEKFGYIKLADKGTLFLDELSELTIGMQVKLLRVLEDGWYSPLGSAEQRQSKFRIIAASNRSLEPLISSGSIRADFYYRVNVVPIHIPPLRERRTDIPLLIEHFLKNKNRDKELSDLPGPVLTTLCSHDWPGNVRELKNALDRYLALGELHIANTPQAWTEQPVGGGLRRQAGEWNLNNALEEYEKQMILSALEQTKWHRGKTSDLLGLSRRSLFRRMQRLGLD